MPVRRRDNSVGIATIRERRTRNAVRFLERQQIFLFFKPSILAPTVPFSSIQCQDLDCVELHLHSLVCLYACHTDCSGQTAWQKVEKEYRVPVMKTETARHHKILIHLLIAVKLSTRPRYGRTRLQCHERVWVFCVVITEEYNVMVNGEELTGTTKYLTQ
jgi:hypothetical protein